MSDLLLQRQLIAQKMKQKRQTGAGGMVQASNISSAQLSGRSSAWQHELYGNDANLWLHRIAFPFFHFFSAVLLASIYSLVDYRLRWSTTL